MQPITYPVNRALRGIGRAIGEGAEGGGPFHNSRAGMQLGRVREAVKCPPRDPERLAERAAKQRWHRRASRA